MTKKFNPITGQWEDDNVQETKNTTFNTASKRKKFNPITNQWEDVEYSDQNLMSQQSSIGGLQQPNPFRNPAASTNLGQGIVTYGAQINPQEVDKKPKYSVMDILGVGNYASAKFADSLGKGDSIVDALGKAANEISKTISSTYKASVFGPQEETPNTEPERVTYSQVIKDVAPQFAKDHPIATMLAGLVGDIALDPTTYVSFGTETGARLAGQKLSNKGIDLVRNLNTVAEDGIRYVIKNKQGLERVGYLGIDEIQKINNTKLLQDLTQGAIDGDKAALGQLNTIINAQTRGFKGQLTEVNKMTSAQREMTVESNFLKMAQSDPKLILEGGNTGLFINIPFSPKRIAVIPPKYVDKALDSIPGLSAIRNGISDRLRESNLIGLVSRDMPLGDQLEYIRLRDTLYGEQNIVDHSIVPAIKQFSELPEDSRNTLRDLALRIDERIAVKEAAQGRKLTPQSAALTRTYALNDALSKGTITQDEFNIFGKFIEAHNRMADLEATTRLYQQATDSNLFFGKTSIGEKVAPSDLTDMDFAVLYALKVKTSGYREAQRHFDSGLQMMFGAVDNKGNFVLDRSMIPDNVKKDLDFIGTSHYSAFLKNQPAMDAVKKGLGLIGEFNNVYKPIAYSARPMAATKQYVGNTLQGFAKIGSGIFKGALDPRSLVDATVMVLDNSAYSKYIPSHLIDNLQKFGTPVGKIIYAIDRFQPELIKDLTLTTRLGLRMDGLQLADEAMRYRIYNKGQDILSLDQTKNLRLQIAKANGISSFQEEKWQQGLFTMAKESIPWINLPNYVENINRMSLYINARRLGIDAEQSSKLVKDALFDYQHGTTEFENLFMKRMIPFYTFQRFALPLVASLVKEPGRASNLTKITKNFLEAYHYFATDQQLTDAQRRVLPGYLLEQPNVYAGTQQDGTTQKGIFRTFNSYVFTDFLSLVQTKVDGSMDYGGTVQKMTLAQITPLLKVPLEIAAKKNFFTDLPIGVGGKVESGNYVGFYDKWLPDNIKHLIGYEIRTNPVTGEAQGYVNPYLTYTMTTFAPMLNDYIAIPKNSLNAREAAMRMLTGVGTIKLDFQKEQHYRIKEYQDMIHQLQLDMRNAYFANNTQKIGEDQKRLNILVDKMAKIASLNVQK